MFLAKPAIVAGFSNDITKFPVYFAFVDISSSSETNLFLILSNSTRSSTAALSVTSFLTCAWAKISPFVL